jgi:hypothetical protein
MWVRQVRHFVLQSVPSTGSGLLLLYIPASLYSGISLQSEMMWWLCGRMCLFYNVIEVRGVICNSASELWIHFLPFHEIRSMNSLLYWQLRNCGLIPRRVKRYTFYTKRSIPARGPNRLPIQLVPGISFPAVKAVWAWSSPLTSIQYRS